MTRQDRTRTKLPREMFPIIRVLGAATPFVSNPDFHENWLTDGISYECNVFQWVAVVSLVGSCGGDRG